MSGLHNINDVLTIEPPIVFEEAIATTTLVRPSLGRALVGWRPLKPSLVDGMRVYYAAWQAAQ